jgi:hypothetical protein
VKENRSRRNGRVEKTILAGPAEDLMRERVCAKVVVIEVEEKGQMTGEEMIIIKRGQAHDEAVVVEVLAANTAAGALYRNSRTVDTPAKARAASSFGRFPRESQQSLELAAVGSAT